jgi:hypothetical protein
MKTNREKNTAYDRSQRDRVRPKRGNYDWESLDAVIRLWAKDSRERSTLQFKTLDSI